MYEVVVEFGASATSRILVLISPLVIVGASFTLITVRATDLITLAIPSLAVTVISYILLAPESDGAS